MLVAALILYGAIFFGAGLSFKLGYFEKAKSFLQLKSQNLKNKSAFATPIQSPLPYSDEQSGTVIGTYIKLCSNTVYSFEISYPKDWFTTYNTDNEKCTYFAPYSFTVLPDPTANDLPIKVEVVKPEDWEATQKFYENPNDFQNIISTQNVEVNGMSAQKVTAQTTGNESLERGLLKVSYLIFNSRLPIVITYQQLTAKENPDEYKKILDDMAKSLNYF